MSATYAQRLKEYPNKGTCGLPEIHDTKRAFSSKIKKLISLIQNAKSITILTGAGVSTSCGIPDFRGPDGIWTKEKENNNSNRKQKNTQKLTKSVGNEGPIEQRNSRLVRDANVVTNEIKSSANINFQNAKPSLTHHAITYLVQKTSLPIRLVVTQNVDGLHQRSGLSRNKLSILHGCAFSEECLQCHRVYYRDYEIEGISFQKTGRMCDYCNENGELVDTLLDWDDPLPEYDFHRAVDACQRSDLTISLGTSLRIEPAGSLPSFSKQYVIINLQETPVDSRASIIIRSYVDNVMKSIMTELGYYDDFVQNMNHEVIIERIWLPPQLHKEKEEEQTTTTKSQRRQQHQRNKRQRTIINAKRQHTKKRKRTKV